MTKQRKYSVSVKITSDGRMTAGVSSGAQCGLMEFETLIMQFANGVRAKMLALAKARIVEERAAAAATKKARKKPLPAPRKGKTS